MRGLHFVDNNDSLRHLGRAHHPVTVRGIVEGQHLPAFHLVQASAARALQNLGPLVFGDDALHLHQQQVLGFLTDGPLHEVHLDTSLAQFLQDNLLVDVVASQSVGGVHQYQVEQAVRGRVPQRIQAGPVQA
ncbi:hypothetical protein KYC5002_26620 [Archangium violaceum]|nr:hypothetical protein KYC5002_26620 [Archangium gephyra]